MNTYLEDNYNRLLSIIEKYNKIGVMFSGGVDSMLLAYAAKSALEPQNTALFFVASSMDSLSMHRRAHTRANELGLTLIQAEGKELEGENLRKNPVNRCYLCRKHRHTLCRELAASRGFHTLADGTHTDDLVDYRPGLKAAYEDGVVHPLAEAGFDKANIREISRHLGIKGADDAASPCLATRIPYNHALDAKTLRRVGEAEDFLKSMGVDGARVRLYEPNAAVVEVPENIVDALFTERKKWSSALLAMGFTAVALDMEGYVSGKFLRVVNLKDTK